jgi:hypothetical protein
MHIFSSYLKGNTLPLYYNTLSVNVPHGQSQEPSDTHRCALWVECRILVFTWASWVKWNILLLLGYELMQDFIWNTDCEAGTAKHYLTRREDEIYKE